MLLLFIWLNYGVISLGFIAFFIHFLGKKAQFQWSFYRLLKCDLILNTLTYCSTWVIRLAHQEDTKEFMLGIYKNHYWVFQLSGFFSNYFFHAQSVSTLILVFHRYSFSKFNSAKLFWNENYLAVFILGMVYCSCITIPLYSMGMVAPMAWCEETQRFEMQRLSPTRGMIFAISFFTLSLIYFSLIIILGCLTLFELKKRLSGTYCSERTRRMRRQMTKIVCINSIIYLIVIIWQVMVMMLFKHWTPAEQDTILMTVSDMLSLSMPYLLIIFDKSVRATFLRNVKDTLLPAFSFSSVVQVNLGNENTGNVVRTPTVRFQNQSQLRNI